MATSKGWTAKALGLALAAALVAGFAPACSGSDDPASGSSGIASTATMTIVQPAQGEIVEGPIMRVKIDLEGGTVLREATNDIRPDEGHIHLSLDGELSTMTFGLDEEIAVTPGRHILQAEFVAGNHVPFSPRVIQARSIEVR